ncbi:MAG TPA: GAF domain-containing protein, partial [Blattabacteriaceae bacterium]|nr:GAF domain-containing protein [Blattabacteriaceae bacterium]
MSAQALMEHAGSYARQAIGHNQQLSFKFSYRSDEKEVIYHGLAQPILTTGAAAVLLMVRKIGFTSAENSAFSVMGNMGRMALDNSELTGLYGVQKQKLDQLLEISADLGTSRLESFFPAFVVRAAEFLGVSRAFVALADQGECRLRWAASKGAASRLDIDISAVAKRVLESKNPQVCEDINQLSSIEKAQLRRWESDLKQYLGIPLLTGDGRQLGVLGFLDKKDKTRFSSEDVRRARVLGAEITVALEAAHNLQLSDQHRKRTEDLMEMALDLGSALRLPDFVKNFTERVASMIGARSAILSLA